MTILARLVGTALIVVALRDIFQQLLPPERGRLTELDAHAECLARIPPRCGRLLVHNQATSWGMDR